MGLTAGNYGGQQLDSSQVAIADTIAQVAKAKGASSRDLTVAYMTAMQESSLRNLTTAADHDSLGVFQQRPSQGWGTPAQVTNVTYAAGKFFDSLFKVPNRDSLPLSAEAQAVQRSAFPTAYAKWQAMADALVSQNPGGGAPESGGSSIPGLDGITSIGNALGSISDTVAAFSKLALWLAMPTHWVRIFAGGFGVVFVFFGLHMIAKEVRGG